MKTRNEAKRGEALAEYRGKRRFDRTTEPKGHIAPGAESGGIFVIQKHRARRLHFDFRLELDGVLKSWAIPRGPSNDPSEKRLAVRTEDHPVEYGSFEGNIPEGEYGAGAVMLWDRGVWAPRGDPRKGLERGELKFDLRGERLRGGFVLVRLAPRKKEKHENWLLIKERDERAERDSHAERNWSRSVATGRSFDEIAAGDDVWSSSESAQPKAGSARKFIKRTIPKFRSPELATLAKNPPPGEGWGHEIKFDGYRLLAAIAVGRSKLYTRSGLDWTEKFAPLADALAQLAPNSAFIDGEAVVIDERGRSDFGRLQRALKAGGEIVHYYAFDLLELNGEDITSRPLAERKALLEAILAEAPDMIHYSEHIIGDGMKVLAESCRLGLEGIVSKRLDSPYASRRTHSWIKSKCSGRDEFVVGGWRPSDKKSRAFASLLLGEFEDGALRYRGRVGGGFTGKTLDELFRRLSRLERRKSPFIDAPASISRSAHWVAPQLVVEVAYTERTEEGYLRHPIFLGLREDKFSVEVETPAEQRPAAPLPRAAPSVKITHPDKVMYPEVCVNKAEVAAHWRLVAPFAMPHIIGRPISLVRCPNGAAASCFFQRHYSRGMPRALLPAPLPDSKGKVEQFLRIEAVEGLEAAAQLGALELHLWGAHVETLERPDRLVLDLDPDPAVSFREVKQAARDLRDLLAAAEVKTFAMLTGGKGIHVVAPLVPNLSWSEIGDFARGLAMQLAGNDPARFTAVMTKAKRIGKIYIDYLRNERGASAIAPYSPRARASASVATPIAWSELAAVEKADAYTIESIRRRIAALRGRDPWAGYFEIEQRISAAAIRMFSRAK